MAQARPSTPSSAWRRPPLRAPRWTSTKPRATLLAEIRRNAGSPRDPVLRHLRAHDGAHRTGARRPGARRTPADGCESNTTLRRPRPRGGRCRPRRGARRPRVAAEGYAEAAGRWERFGVVPEQAFALLGQGRCLTALGQATEATHALSTPARSSTRSRQRPLWPKPTRSSSRPPRSAHRSRFGVRLRRSLLRVRAWAYLGLNQGPPACEAGALPLSYTPGKRPGMLADERCVSGQIRTAPGAGDGWRQEGRRSPRAPPRRGAPPSVSRSDFRRLGDAGADDRVMQAADDAGQHASRSRVVRAEVALDPDGRRRGRRPQRRISGRDGRRSTDGRRRA